jgi:hypothetical protein
MASVRRLHHGAEFAHNLGKLTRGRVQQPKARTDLLNQLQVIRIEVRDDRISVGVSHVELCANVSKEFILWLDLQACS